MKKSENIQITEFDKKANVHNMELLPVVCLPVYKEIVKEMAELIEDKQAREVFCSLSSGSPKCFTDNRHFVQEPGIHV